ncbi:MAG TPA: immunoglobulin domain-containing protein, partial [Clostridia bacterium]|nr:immunoglobulin domain-containing protein [Clostridia bacterium]
YQLIASNAFGVSTSSVCQVNVSRLASFGGIFNLTNLTAEVGNLLAVSASSSHLLAIRPDHTIATWGARVTPATNVPAGLGNVVAVSAGTDFSAALKADGTVVAWGIGTLGQTNVPPGLSNVIALSSAVRHTLALRADGTVAAWGANSLGITNVPAGLSNVLAVSAGTYHSLALQRDGAIVGWGQAGTIPAGLKAAAIAAGSDVSLALKFDGTVTSWSGFQLPAAANPPTGLSNVVAIAAARGTEQRPAGAGPFAALQSNGTVTIWGDGTYEQFPIPPGLTSAMDLSCASSYIVALLNDRSPHVTIQPADQKILTGSNVTFAAFAVGAPPLQWQWFRNGIGLSGATGQQLNLASVTRSDRASYSAVVTNALGLAGTRAAQLDVGGLIQLSSSFVTAAGALAVAGQDSSGSPLLGPDLVRFEPQASTNLVDWQPLVGALSITNGFLLLQDTNYLQFPARYYRLLESDF